MRSMLIYPWQLAEFIKWVKPDVSDWIINGKKFGDFVRSDLEKIDDYIIPFLSHYDYLQWCEDGRLYGIKNSIGEEIDKNFKGFRFNGLFYSGMYDVDEDI